MRPKLNSQIGYRRSMATVQTVLGQRQRLVTEYRVKWVQSKKGQMPEEWVQMEDLHPSVLTSYLSDVTPGTAPDHHQLTRLNASGRPVPWTLMHDPARSRYIAALEEAAASSGSSNQVDDRKKPDEVTEGLRILLRTLLRHIEPTTWATTSQALSVFPDDNLHEFPLADFLTLHDHCLLERARQAGERLREAEDRASRAETALERLRISLKLSV